MWWVVAVVTAVALVATYLTWLAGRVDRLHARAAAASRALDAHLLRRAAAAALLADESGGPELYAAAREALDAGADDREAAENDLTRHLKAARASGGALRTLASESPDGAGDGVVAASRRVAVARQVHTDLVRDALAVRRHPVVRLLRLTRRHRRPAYFDIDDPTLDGAVTGAAVPAETAVRSATGQSTQA